MRFFFFFFWILVAAAQMTVLWSLQEEQSEFYVEEIATYPIVSFSGNHFSSGKGNWSTFGSA